VKPIGGRIQNRGRRANDSQRNQYRPRQVRRCVERVRGDELLDERRWSSRLRNSGIAGRSGYRVALFTVILRGREEDETRAFRLEKGGVASSSIWDE